MSAPRKLTRQELMTQLFDVLMQSIEPKLTTANRKRTATELAAMSPEERKEWMEYFRGAYEEFVKAWPAFIEKAVKNVTDMAGTLEGMAAQRDASAMQDIENAIGFDDA